MQTDDDGRGDELRQAMRRRLDARTPQAVYNQHANDCRRKDLAQISDIGRCLSLKNLERKKAQQDGHCSHHRDKHAGFHAAFTVLFRSSVSTSVISSMAGIRNLSAPNIKRQSNVLTTPVIAGI